ncbi:MAG: lysophospholipid acyltransferase family protein [Candidatus Pacebacteria bacterium]|nr:lysophospholipid acyltransferase family protein [Candidatus Paceibacterota bacterium]
MAILKSPKPFKNIAGCKAKTSGTGHSIIGLWLRSGLFFLAFNLTLLVQGILSLPLLPLPLAIVRPFVLSWIAMQFWFLRHICGLGFRLEGLDNIPNQPVILASKHESAWDTFVFLHLASDPAYVLKQELFHVPFYGWWGRKMGMIGVDRGGHSAALRKLLSESKSALESGRHLVIFPQGTRTMAGSGKPYQAGVYAIYRDSRVAVVPVALNSGLFWPKRSLKRFPGTITLSFLPAIPPGLGRAEFMARLEQQLEGESLRLQNSPNG